MLADKMVFMADLREKHQQELENLTLTTQPFKTIKLFILGVIQYLKRSVLYLLAKGGWLMLSCTVVAALGILLVTIDGPHEKVMLVNVNSSLTFHLEELSEYFRFGLWWVALGVASSIGLGSGLHTFVLYLGPHIALFTIKAMQCGRVDLKSAPYDTIQLKRGPSWLDKDCDEFGPPLFSSSEGSRVPLSSILPQVQLEAILWGVGTALGELPPYFISRAASISGSRLDAMDEFDDSSTESDGVVAARLKKIKRWFFTHSQHLNFLTILVLASVPNPLFDLAGIMCGQFGVPFWKFFLATLIGKAIIKTHIQTVFIISVCNNQLLDWIENELIWVLSLVPGFAPVLPSLVAKLHTMRAKYLKPQQPSSHIKVKKWDFSFASVWNTIVWLMLMNFFVKIVTDTAQRYLKKQQDKEIAALTNNSSASRQSSIEVQSDGFTSFSHHRSPENRILQQVLIQKLV
ncbi:vacuole membrane protein KMS1 [Citrus sinensis]|nr:vacuole membrane protein KMS1 [Citrus sinensis]